MPLESATASRHLSRAGVWATGARQLDLPIRAAGLSEITISSGLLKVTPDYDVLTWLCERWLRRPTESGWMRPSYYEIGADLFDRPPSGQDYQTLRDSLQRLASLSVTIHCYNAETGAADPLWDLDTHLLSAARPRSEPQGLQRPAIRLSEDIRREIDHGAPLRLNWRVLRGFRKQQKLAKRLWIYVQAETWKRQGEGLEATWIAVGDRLFAALGMNYAHHRQARHALARACTTITTVDDRLERLELQQQGKRYRLIAERATEARWAKRRQARSTIAESLAS